MGPNAGAARHAVRISPCKADNLGCASGRTSCRKHPKRQRARRSAGSPRTRHVPDHPWSSGRRTGTPTYKVLEALCGCACTSAWTVAALPRCRARTSHASPPRRRACCVITFLEQISIPEQISRFSLQFEVSGAWLGDFSKFCVSDNKVKCEFINTIPDSSFTLRALACVERAR